VNRWLLKTEPGEYSWDDLVRDRRTAWTGVKNPLALKHIREMNKGDEALIYHTGDQRAIVGIAKIVSAPRPDPKGGPKSAVVDLEPAKPLANPVTLARIKADSAFAGWELLRIGRLSVMPVPPAMWKRIESLANQSASSSNTTGGRKTGRSKS
jgi:predicted RNA-binding protein with PUA-like domain